MKTYTKDMQAEELTAHSVLEEVVGVQLTPSRSDRTSEVRHYVGITLALNVNHERP
jgi:hypothetical protein